MNYLDFRFLFILLFFLSSCANDLSHLAKFDLGDDIDAGKAQDVELIYSDSAIVRAKIFAPLMYDRIKDRKRYQEFPEGMEGQFFNENGRVVSQLSSRYAEYHNKQSKVVLEDSIVIWNKNNERLETEELIWEENKKRIYSTQFVKITTPSEIIYGYGFESNLEFTQWEIRSVKGRIQSKNFMDNPIQ